MENNYGGMAKPTDQTAIWDAIKNQQDAIKIQQQQMMQVLEVLVSRNNSNPPSYLPSSALSTSSMGSDVATSFEQKN